MKPEEKKILNDSLVKLFKITPEDLSSLYNEDGDLIDFSVVLKADAERIRNFTTEKNNQYSRGIKEGAQKIEREIKEKYGIESDLIGVDLVDHIIVEKVSEAKSSESIKEHPEFLKARSEWVKEQKNRDKEWEKKIEEIQQKYEKAKLFDTIKSKAGELLEQWKPIYPNNPVVANNIKNLFFAELERGNYRNEEDEIHVLDNENNPVKDSHGYPKNFNDYVKEIADRYFEYQVAEHRSSSGNKAPTGQGVPQFPRDENERLTMLRDPNITPARRKELTEYVIK